MDDRAQLPTEKPADGRQEPELFTLASLDGRTRRAKPYTALVSAICADLGGDEALSELELAIARRCAFIALQCEAIEARALRGVELDRGDIELHASLSDRLRRLGQSVGLQRRSRDVTVDLKTYLASKGRT